MKKTFLLLLFFLPFIVKSQSNLEINKLGYHIGKVKEFASEKKLKLIQETIFNEDKATLIMYSDPIMPVMYSYVFDPTYRICYGLSISINKEDKVYMDEFIKVLNDEIKKESANSWIETRDDLVFRWSLTQDKANNFMLFVKKIKK